MSQIKPANSDWSVAPAMDSNIVWLNNPKLLIVDGRWRTFFPTRNMTREEAFNAGSRLIIYLSLSLFLYSQRTTYLITGIGAILLGFIWYQYYPKLVDTFSPQSNSTNLGADIHHQYTTTPPPPSRRRFKYVNPSDNNPFMNVMPSDYTTNPDRASSFQKPCRNFDLIQDQVDQKFNASLFKDVGDIFGRDASQRQFYTTPNTAIPNDQDTFARWLYKSSGATCKEGICQPQHRYIGR